MLSFNGHDLSCEVITNTQPVSVDNIESLLQTSSMIDNVDSQLSENNLTIAPDPELIIIPTTDPSHSSFDHMNDYLITPDPSTDHEISITGNNNSVLELHDLSNASGMLHQLLRTLNKNYLMTLFYSWNKRA